MEIFRPTMTASQSGDLWTLEITADEAFLLEEVGQEFEDWVTLWEWDDSDHDFIDNQEVRRFKLQSVQKRRSWAWEIDGEVLDTELGGEEIRAQIFLRNVATGATINKVTPLLQISPG